MASLLSQLRFERDYVVECLPIRKKPRSCIDALPMPQFLFVRSEVRLSSVESYPPSIVPSAGFFLEHFCPNEVVLLNCLELSGHSVLSIARQTQSRLAVEGKSGVYLVSTGDILPLIGDGIAVEVAPFPSFGNSEQAREDFVEYINFVVQKYRPKSIIDIGRPLPTSLHSFQSQSFE